MMTTTMNSLRVIRAIALTLLCLVAVSVFAVLVAAMNVTTALYESALLTWDVGKRIVRGVWGCPT